MQMKKFLPAVLVGYILMLALGYVLHEILLHPDYLATQDVWRAHDVFVKKIWVMWVGQLIFVAFFVWVYTRGVENKPWIAQGVRYGIVMTFIVVVPAACTQYAVLPIPYPLALKWMAAGGLQMVVLGLVTAFFHKQS
jgi:hypothetical protein